MGATAAGLLTLPGWLTTGLKVGAVAGAAFAGSQALTPGFSGLNLPPPKDPSSRAGAEAADRERRRRAMARGRGSTILTGSQGLLNPANIGVKQLTGQ